MGVLVKVFRISEGEGGVAVRALRRDWTGGRRVARGVILFWFVFGF